MRRAVWIALGRTSSRRRWHRMIAVTLTLSFMIVSVSLALDLGSRRPQVSAAEADSYAAGAIEQAVSEAQLSGESELVEERMSPTTRVWANPDGTLTAEIAPGPVRVSSEDSASGWERIDTELVSSSDGLVPAASVADVTLSDGGAEPFARIDVEDSHFAMSIPSTLPAPEISGDQVTYEEAYQGSDLVVEARPMGFAQRFILDAPPSEPLVLTLPLDVAGIMPQLDDNGSLGLFDEGGNELLYADPARMWGDERDSHSAEPVHESLVATHLVRDDSGYSLELVPDPQFLHDPDLAYPVTIDPTPDLSASKDTYVQQDFPTTSYGTDTELKSGTYNGGTDKARSFLRFGLSEINGTQILSATMRLWENWSYSCDPSAVEVHRLNSSFTNQTTWNSQPSYGAVYASDSVAKGYSSSCPNGWIELRDGGTDGRKLDDLVQGWADGTIDNEGVAVRAANEGNSNGWKKFNSDNTSGHQPILRVTYNSIPAIPDQLSPLNSSVLEPGDVVLSGRFCDPDGGSGRVNYQVWDSTHSEFITGSWDGRAKIQSCSSHSWTVSGEAFSPGTYQWRARAQDNTTFSPWTTWRTFTISSSSAPSISSQDYPPDGTWHGGAQEPGDFAISATGATAIEYWFDSGSTTTVQGASTNVQWTPSSVGTHVLYARGQYGGGTTSPIATHGFNVGDISGSISTTLGNEVLEANVEEFVLESNPDASWPDEGDEVEDVEIDTIPPDDAPEGYVEPDPVEQYADADGELVDVQVPTTPNGEILFESDSGEPDVTLAMDGSNGEGVSVGEGETAYFNSEDDSDRLVRQTYRGWVEIYDVFRSSSSPHELTLEPELSSGWTIDEEDDVVAVLDDEEVPVLYIAPPEARAADGVEVPTSIGLDGNLVVVTVDPPSGTKYPVTVRRESGYPFNLNSAEAAFCAWPSHFRICLKARTDANKAWSEAELRFSSATLHNGRGDAFRHCLWSARMVVSIGRANARGFGDRHEASSSGNEKTMDLRNNAIGRGIGDANDNSSLPNYLNRVVCERKAKNGGLWKLVNGQLQLT